MHKFIVNHVMSNEVHSKIFSDILGYFNAFSSDEFLYKSSVYPIQEASIRHYHRPNLEENLINPCIVTVHHDLEESDDWLNFSHFEKQYRQADLIICLNTLQQNFLRLRGIEHTVVIPHGYNDSYLKTVQKKVHGSKIKLGYFSRRYARKVKGEAYLYELSKRLSPEKFEFIMVGQDRTTDARFLRKLGYRVFCYEELPYSVFCSLYNQIDVLLMPSTFEGGPANIPEAIITATPIACSRIGMCVDFVKDNKNGFFLDMNPDIDAKKFDRLYDVPGEMEAFYERAYEESCNAITWQTVVNLHESEYFKIMQRKA